HRLALLPVCPTGLRTATPRQAAINITGLLRTYDMFTQIKTLNDFNKPCRQGVPGRLSYNY
ncbi:MAG: hypothetical protein RBS80_28610, partial [Thermoguttaceae bacterium]|nr:hypothetical protein [Thermoguttaceae bacterium]